MTFEEQYKHPEWQRKRLEVLELNGFQCTECGAKDKQLHVHHPYYRRGALLWEYRALELQCLCNRCHEAAHFIDEAIKEAMSIMPLKEKLRLLGYADAYCVHSQNLFNNSDHYRRGVGDYELGKEASRK